MFARNLLPRPSPLLAPSTSPAISTRNDLLALDVAVDDVQPRVGDVHHPDIGFDGAERIVLGLDARSGECVEKGALAYVWQTDDAAFHGWDLRRGKILANDGRQSRIPRGDIGTGCEDSAIMP
jgi:hypothetical protein